MRRKNKAQARSEPRSDGTVFGTDLSREEALAPARRYTADRKRQIVSALRRGLATREEVCEAHSMHDDELFCWEVANPAEPPPRPEFARVKDTWR